MAYFGCLGTGGTPVINYNVSLVDYYINGDNDTVASITTKSFDVSNGDTVLLAVMHRTTSSTITVPNGFTLITESSTPLHSGSTNQILSIYYKYFSSNETGIFTVSQTDSSQRLSIMAIQLTGNITLSNWTTFVWDNDIPSGSDYKSYSIQSPTKPVILFCHNVYAGAAAASFENWTMNNLIEEDNGNNNAHIYLSSWKQAVPQDARLQMFMYLGGSVDDVELKCYQHYHEAIGLYLA